MPASSPTPSPQADQALETLIGQMLRFGVTLAAIVIIIGGSLYLAHPGPAPDYHHFHAAPRQAMTISGIVTGIRHADSLSIIQLGVLLLIATPVARVALALIGFARERDHLYTLVSAVVLAILTFSLLHSR